MPGREGSSVGSGALWEAETPLSPAGSPSAHSDLSLCIVLNQLGGQREGVVPGVEALGWARLPN